jgi:PHP family Zn ribbon phosphoesterase
LITNIGDEFKILLDAERKEIEKESLPEIAEGVMRMREGKVFIEPGYDGVYGKIKIFPDKKKKEKSYPQKTLF